MIKGLEPHTPQWKAVRDWVEEQAQSAQTLINEKTTEQGETQYQRGRHDLAREMLSALKPEEPETKRERKPRDASGYV